MSRVPLAPITAQESQESQDEYGRIDLDFDDLALRAALGDDVRLTTPTDYKHNDEALSKVCLIATYTGNCNFMRPSGD